MLSKAILSDLERTESSTIPLGQAVSQTSYRLLSSFPCHVYEVVCFAVLLVVRHPLTIVVVILLDTRLGWCMQALLHVILS